MKGTRSRPPSRPTAALARGGSLAGFVRGLVVAGCLLSPVAVTPAAAQTPFSLVNLGANVESYDARMEGRGGWGMAESDTLIPGFKNLASLTGLTNVVILLSGYHEVRTSETATSEGIDSRRTARVLTPNARVAFPFKSGFGTISAGFRARRATQYFTVKPNSWLIDDLLVQGEEQFERKGTQFEIPLALSVRLGRGINLAASFNLISGSIDERLTTLFVQPRDAIGNALFSPSEKLQKDEFDGSSASFFLLISPFSRVRLGGSYTPPYDVEVKSKIFLDGVARQAAHEFTLTMPREWAAGLALDIGGRWQVGFDYEFREYSRLRGYEPWENDQDEWIWTAGLERRAVRLRHGGLKNLPIRLGVLRHHWGYRVGDVNVSGAVQPVEETRVSLGTGFVFKNGMGSFDLALGYGWVGDKEKNGNEDRVWRLSLSISGLEKWWD